MSRFGQPWMLLVSPTVAWRGLSGGPWPAFITQALLLLVGWLAAAQPMSDLSTVSGLGGSKAGFGSFVVLTVALLTLFLLLSTVVLVLLRALGFSLAYRVVLTWLAYGLTPIFLGRCIGLLSFAVVQPLARDPKEALALQVNPLGFSLAGLFHPLSFPWMVAASFDVFAIWALVLLAFGAAHYLKLGAARSAALVSALLIIWLLALTAVWQGLQRSL